MIPADVAKGVEFVACNLCGSEEADPFCRARVRPYREGVFDRDVWDVHRCRRCGLIYVSPRIDDAARAFFYSFQNPGDRRAVQARFFDTVRPRRPLWTRYLRVLRSHCPSGRLLDVGCGAGDFLAEAQGAGYDAVGQEVSKPFLDHCRQHGLRVLAGYLEDLDLAPGSFDAVTAFDVIEHHPDPTGLVRQMRALLRPGGVAMLSTHDIGNLFARFYGVNWRFLHPISHITYFTRSTLSRMLAGNGFEVVRVAGFHTVDAARAAELRNWVVQGLKLVVLRSLILWLYAPIAKRLPPLRRWKLRVGGRTLDHDKLLARTGEQVVMNDGMVAVARAV